MSTELVTAIDKINVAFKSFKETNDERLEAEAKGNKARAAELNEKLERIESDISDLTKKRNEIERRNAGLQERIELLESLNDRPKGTVKEKMESEYTDAFMKWVRTSGKSQDAHNKMSELRQKAREMKDVTIGTAIDGGHGVPEQISAMVDALLLKQSDILSRVKTVQVGTSDYKELISIHGGTSGWVGETGTRSATGTPNLRQVAPTWGELYAYPQASEWSLQDVFFDVQEWLVNDIVDGMRKNLDVAIWSGNGTNKPTGMTNATLVTTSDTASPLRAAAAFQYIPTNATSPQAVNADDIIDLVYTLNRAYRPGSSFGCNTLTQGAIRKLKSSNGDYYWQPSLQAGQPDRLLGYDVFTFEDMADPTTADGFYLGFGDWRRAYTLAYRRELATTVENVTNPGYVKFYVRRRYGGIVANNDCLKFLKLADT